MQKNSDETKYIYIFHIKQKNIERYNEIRYNFSNTSKKIFDSEPVYNEKYLKTKIKYYEGKINTNFHNGKIPNEGSHCIFP